MEQSIKDDSTSNGVYDSGKKELCPNLLYIPSEDEMKPAAQTSRGSCINSTSEKNILAKVKKFDIFHSINSSSASKSNLIRNEFLAKYEMSTVSQKYSEHSLKKTNELKYNIEPPKNSSAPKV